MGSTSPLSYKHPLVAERAIDEPRPLKVTYIGAGLSGIIAGILLPKHVPGLDLTIYEKNEDLGGTWFENTYPGCACDIPSHAYQLSFESNLSWSKFYVGAPEIRQYWQRVADKYDVRKFIKFKHKCLEARWDNDITKWRCKFEDISTGRIFEEISDVFITGQGILNQWKWPNIKGLRDFKGKLMHSATWDQTFDPTNKTLAIIGSGSSAIQLVPALQSKATHIDNYIRSQTWISATFGHELVHQRNDGNDGNFTHTSSELQSWSSDPSIYKAYRKQVETAMLKGYNVTHRGSAENKGAAAFFEADMRSRLAAKPELADKLIPKFSPLCRRLTPGPGYLEALTSSNVNVITSEISHVTATGIVSEGTHREVDAIICATGFDTSFTRRTPIITGRTPTPLNDRYSVRADSYLSIGVNTFPNFFQVAGPNSGQVNGNFVVVIEAITLYICKLLLRLSTSGAVTIEPKLESVKGFTDFCDAFFERTVFTEDCRSWFKANVNVNGDGDGEGERKGRIAALWPGGAAHALKAFEEVRWEDWVCGYPEGSAEFAWLGNGFTHAEKIGDDEGLVKFLD